MDTYAELERQWRKSQDAVRALESENKRLKEKMAGMVTPVKIAKELPRRGAYLIGKSDGTLLCSGKRPLNMAQVAGAMLGIDGKATATIYRLVPWRSVHVDRVSPEWSRRGKVDDTDKRDEDREASPKKNSESGTRNPAMRSRSREEMLSDIDEICGTGIDSNASQP